MDTKDELKRLRDEYIKRSKDAEAIWRVEHAGEMQNLPAVTFQHADFADGPYGHGYVMTIKINLYARPEEIEKALTTAIMSRIKLNQDLLLTDNPESRRPDFKTGRGKRAPETQIEQLSICLDVFDKLANGMSIFDVTRVIYKTDPTQMSWESGCKKVSLKRIKALKLIEAAKSGTFPDIP